MFTNPKPQARPALGAGTGLTPKPDPGDHCRAPHKGDRLARPQAALLTQVRFAAMCAAACALLLSARPAQAQRIYHIESVLPRVAQRGTQVDIVISGVQLADPRELVFYRPGIRCTAIGPVTEILGEGSKPVKYGLAHGGMISEQTRCRLEIAPDCPLGEHPFHVRRGTVLSVVSTFYVTPFPCVDEYEMRPHTNDSRVAADEVPINATVRGSIRQLSAQDVDYYKVRTYAGRKITAECDMAQIAEAHIGASEIDIAVRILDEQGNELAAGDDSGLHVQDPIVTAVSPANGYVYIEVKQSTFTPISSAAYGLGGLPYNLHVGTFARPLAAYPAGGPVGEKLTVSMLGDAGGGNRQVEVPNEPGFFDYYGDAPSPLKLRASPYPNVLEPPAVPAPPARAGAKPGKQAPAVEPPVAELPVALNGIIATDEETDRFRFRVAQSSRWRIRTFASALGTPLDPIVRLRPVAADGTVGEVEVEADDSTLTERDIFGHYPRSGGGLKDVLDPSFIFTPKLDGLYELEITDRAGVGTPRSVYRIEIEPATDGLACALYNQGIYVARGSRRAVQLRVDMLQGNTYAGEIRIVAEGLPPGVTFHCAPIPAGTPLPVPLWPAVLEASPTADVAVGRFRLVAQSVSPAPPVRSAFQWKAPFIIQTGGDALHLVALEQMACVVTDEPPFTVEASAPATVLARDGELAIPVKIRRRKDFVEPITVDLPWLPFGVGKAAALTLEDDQTEAQLLVSAGVNAKLGRWSLPVTARAMLPEGRGPLDIASPLVELTVAEPFVELAASLESLRRGERKRYVWSVTPKNGFDGAATVRLLGLPKGVAQVGPPPTITGNTREVAFEIEAGDEALLGPVTGVACEVILQSGGQEIHQRSGNATLRIDPKL